MMKHKIDVNTAIEILLYITQRCTNMYNVLKVIYFADKEHLTQYGQLMYGETYVAMSHGPVPSGAYDLVKYVRGDGLWAYQLPLDIGFSVKKYHLTPHRQANEDYLSESIIDCLDEAIQNYGHLSFSQLKEMSHQERAYQAADENDFIPLETIIHSLPNSEMLLDYIHTN